MWVCADMALGRRVELIERMPKSEACWARKRNNMDCAFSALRAMIEGSEVFGRAVLWRWRGVRTHRSREGLEQYRRVMERADRFRCRKSKLERR